MPARRSAMRKIRDVLRLKFEVGLSHEKIAAATGMSKGAVTGGCADCPGHASPGLPARGSCCWAQTPRGSE